MHVCVFHMWRVCVCVCGMWCIPRVAFVLALSLRHEYAHRCISLEGYIYVRVHSM